ncbi:MAG: hypothetical protein NTX59_09215 [Elusimicrobia bacterium]|nr:hypothetical protein [Elusimicrobiota bacterium]
MKKSTKLAGAGLILAAIAAAGTYFLTGKRGEKNRKKIAAWTLKMKGDVLEKMKEMKEVNKEAYFALVEDVAGRYERLGQVGSAEIKHLTKELKEAWAHIAKQTKKPA